MPTELKEKNVKTRRITAKDYSRVEAHIIDMLAERKGSQARKDHSKIWSEVDRQISMTPPDTLNKSGNPDEDWHSAIQMGAIADALEVLSADVMRMAFPLDRKWFRPHINIEWEVDPETGDILFDPEEQKVQDGVLRSFMAQQHSDFGHRDRMKASVKEALSHGGFVGEVRMENLRKFSSRGRTQTIKAPVLIPYSMWNAYPDPSPSIMGTDLFYRGSMILQSHMPRHTFENITSFIRKDKVPKKKNRVGKDSINDVEIVTYFGDLSLPRSDGEIFLPNMKVILANETLVYIKENDLPYSPIIYAGYEKDSLVDPYFTSPLIKRSPTHKVFTELSNRFIDASQLKAEPPGFYDSYDSSVVNQGGLDISPGAQTGIKGGGANVKFLDVGDPSFLFEAARQLKQEVEQGTAVDATRAGVSASTEQTAFEVQKKDQKGEVRTVDFLSVLDRQVSKPFLTMQHDLNKKHLTDYPFFNSEVHTPDFLTMSKKDLPSDVIFEVVGSKEVLGEESRIGRFAQAISAAASIPQVSEKTNWERVTEEVWNSTGIKDPEQFVNVEEGEPEITPEQMAQMQEAMEQMQNELGESKQKIAELEIREEGLRVVNDKLEAEINLLEEQTQTITMLESREQAIKDEIHKAEMARVKADGKADKEMEEKELDLKHKEIVLKAGVEIFKAKASGDQEKEKAAKDEVKKLNIEGLDKLVASIENAKNNDDIEKLIEAIGKPRKVVRDDLGRIDGLEDG